MAPVTRRVSFPKVLIERDSDSEQSSSEEEEEETLEEEEETLEEEDGVTENGKIEKLEVGLDTNRKGKALITISLKKVCKVTPFFSLLHKSFFFLYKSCFFFLMISFGTVSWVLLLMVCFSCRYVRSLDMKQASRVLPILIAQ